MFYPLFVPHSPSSGSEDHREPSWELRDTLVPPEGEALSVLLLLTAPSLVPKETWTVEDDNSKPLTLLAALGSTAERTSPAGLVPITPQVLEGRWRLVKTPLHSSTQIPPGSVRKTLRCHHSGEKTGSKWG